MHSKKHQYVWLNALALALLLTLLTVPIGCSNSSSNQTLTFSQLITDSKKYNGQTVTLEAFYFSGFEISALSESVGPSTSGIWRIVPKGTLVWVESGIPQGTFDKLYRQIDTLSGYAESIGRLKITGKFETGGKYGHLDAYEHKIAITQAELLEWTPPPGAITTNNGNLQVKVTDLTGKPLDGAKVVSEEQPDGQMKVTGITNGDGIVTFYDIKAGNYRFYLSRFDYTQTDLTTSVASGQTASEEVHMVGEGWARTSSPQLISEPRSINFFTRPGIIPPQQEIQISAISGPLDWSLSFNAPWLTVSPTRGKASSTKETVIVSANTTGLVQGSYNATITLRREGTDWTQDILAGLFITTTEANQSMDIKIKPEPGSRLTEGISFEGATVSTCILERSGGNGWRKERFNAGDLALLVTGTMKNDTDQDLIVIYHAEGYDGEGKAVSWTLDVDPGPLAGIVNIDIPAKSEKNFQLHLSWAENIEQIEMSAGIFRTPG
jgi:hypothetical protein